MEPACDAPHDGGASRNQLGGWLRDRNSYDEAREQGIPSVIRCHLGADFIIAWERNS